MQLVKAHRVIADRYQRVLDDGPLPDGPILLQAERFLADSAEFVAGRAPVGVMWPNNRKVSDLAPHLERLAVVALRFPTFKDGRAYSQARQLREQFGFHGELRATGDVLRDQYLFMVRAGFDAFEVKKDADVATFANPPARYSVFYQPAGDARAPALQRRLDERRDRPAPALQPAGFEPAD
jgi:uncharacterized protein (DUF934 family)